MSQEIDFGLNLLRDLNEIRKEYSSHTIKTLDKNDGSPVTELDKRLNDYIVSSIRKTFSKDSIVSEEEAAAIQSSSARTWFIDPLDGTKEYINHLPEWSVHLGLVENGHVVFGMVGALEMNKVYFATKGGGAFLNTLDSQNEPKRLSCQSVTQLKDIRLVTSRSRNDERLHSFAQKNQIQNKKPLGSMGLKLCAIAEGEADLYLNHEGSCHLWDTCAPSIILEEAGGHVSYMDGDQIDYVNFKDTKLLKGLVTSSGTVWHLLKNQLI